ncbi:alpha/beta hydrolase [uncultured Jatrophihabitans sp.]|uniref:alpha/beta hydrolase n=1 Tax=uncultured Jatrophihabitans sp. TaxID=1610747 RepID=UPI0035CAEDDF
MPVPLRTAAFWTVYKLLDRAPVMQQPAEKVRAAADARAKFLRMPGAWLIAGRADPHAEITERAAKSSDGVELPLRVYRPKDAGTAVLPVVVNFHGGGWVSGDARQSEWWASALAAQAHVVVVSVEYRLAPEHPFPGPAEDCYDATVWVAEHAGEFGVDPQRLAVMGDSAGGNLAAVVSLMARDRGGPAIAQQILIYPSVDLAADLPSEKENGNAPILTSKDIATTPGLYFHNSTREMTDPYASPLRATLDDLPPALIQTAQFDPLRDHGAAYAKALRAAGVPVRLTNYVDAVHGYISLPGIVPAARQALAETIAEVREVLGAVG